MPDSAVQIVNSLLRIGVKRLACLSALVKQESPCWSVAYNGPRYIKWTKGQLTKFHTVEFVLGSLAWSTNFSPFMEPEEPYSDRLCGLVVRVPGYRSRGPRFDFLRSTPLWSSGQSSWLQIQRSKVRLSEK
jgi:hypothetical protein